VRIDVHVDKTLQSETNPVLWVFLLRRQFKRLQLFSLTRRLFRNLNENFLAYALRIYIFMTEAQTPKESVPQQPQQNRCERCGTVFRSPEDLENHRVECHKRFG
jgi:hypothetical protein